MAGRTIYIKNPREGSHFRRLGGAGGGGGGKAGGHGRTQGNSGTGVSQINSIIFAIFQGGGANPFLDGFLQNNTYPYIPPVQTGFVNGLTDAFGNSLYAPTKPFSPGGNKHQEINYATGPTFGVDLPGYGDFAIPTDYTPYDPFYKYVPFGTPGSLGFDPLSGGPAPRFAGELPSQYLTPSNKNASAPSKVLQAYRILQQQDPMTGKPLEKGRGSIVIGGKEHSITP